VLYIDICSNYITLNNKVSFYVI